MSKMETYKMIWESFMLIKDLDKENKRKSGIFWFFGIYLFYEEPAKYSDNLITNLNLINYFRGMSLCRNRQNIV